jgi:hypothetical protein
VATEPRRGLAVPDTVPGSAKADEARRRRRVLASRPSLRADRLSRFALTKVIFEEGHLALERDDAFTDAAVVRYR